MGVKISMDFKIVIYERDCVGNEKSSSGKTLTRSREGGGGSRLKFTCRVEGKMHLVLIKIAQVTFAMVEQIKLQ